MPSAPGNTQASARKEGTTLSRAMRPVNNIVERFIPSALVFSIALTFIVAILALILTDMGFSCGHAARMARNTSSG